MKYLITGGTGFIGSNIARKLINNGENVFLLVRKGYKDWRIKDIKEKLVIYRADILDRKKLVTTLRKIKPDAVFHLATYGAYSRQNDEKKILQANIFGTKNIVDACLDLNLKFFVNTGSSSEYGFKNKRTKETDFLEPNSCYAVSKAAGTQYCSYAAKRYNAPIMTFRLYSVYGPYEEPSRLIPTLIRSALKGHKVKLVSPTIARDFIYIDDLIDAYLCLKNKKINYGEIFNIGSGVQSTLHDVVDIVEKITGKKIMVEWNAMSPRLWDTNIWVSDITKAKEILHWRPKHDLSKGILKFTKWLKDI